MENINKSILRFSTNFLEKRILSNLSDVPNFYILSNNKVKYIELTLDQKNEEENITDFKNKQLSDISAKFKDNIQFDLLNITIKKIKEFAKDEDYIETLISSEIILFNGKDFENNVCKTKYFNKIKEESLNFLVNNLRVLEKDYSDIRGRGESLGLHVIAEYEKKTKILKDAIEDGGKPVLNKADMLRCYEEFLDNLINEANKIYDVVYNNEEPVKKIKRKSSF